MIRIALCLAALVAYGRVASAVTDLCNDPSTGTYTILLYPQLGQENLEGGMYVSVSNPSGNSTTIPIVYDINVDDMSSSGDDFLECGTQVQQVMRWVPVGNCNETISTLGLSTPLVAGNTDIFLVDGSSEGLLRVEVRYTGSSQPLPLLVETRFLDAAGATIFAHEFVPRDQCR